MAKNLKKIVVSGPALAHAVPRVGTVRRPAGEAAIVQGFSASGPDDYGQGGVRAVDCLRFETLVNFAITVIADYVYSTRAKGTFCLNTRKSVGLGAFWPGSRWTLPASPAWPKSDRPRRHAVSRELGFKTFRTASAVLGGH